MLCHGLKGLLVEISCLVRTAKLYISLKVPFSPRLLVQINGQTMIMITVCFKLLFMTAGALFISGTTYWTSHYDSVWSVLRWRCHNVIWSLRIYSCERKHRITIPHHSFYNTHSACLGKHSIQPVCTHHFISHLS